ncbi:helix-turn-helix domain-containing protein [Actinoplanes hulinensis]|uniref:Helix-turn-helix domain-containing protein n=1 Tax=Actinoplanes hulinensis TaxID=1144547 RepID=A0ABS7AYM1_9ACTN|nr:helix-turn-helix domain-containing protein [Actinoplanes hulinensis]MBW6433835.1 helix-turn-helix domain-containing protein [Actinoplanes hulinensis]
MAFVLDTAALPAPERVEAVHTAMMFASAPCHVIHENPAGPVHARMEVWDLGDTNIFTCRSSGLRLLRTARLARQDAMPVISLAVQREGHGRLDQHGHQRVTPPGELLGVDLSGAYDYSWSGDGAAGCVQIPLDQLDLPLDAIRSALGNLRASPLYRLVAAHVATLSRDRARITADPTAPTVAAATVDLVRALLASATRSERHTRRALAETLLTRIRAHVRHHLTDPGLTPARIAAAHNISLRQLYKLCAGAGLSLEQWIINERLRGARHDLLHPGHQHRPVTAIAHSWGFRDVTHFTRRFKARYGLTPTQLRRASADARRPGV